MQIPLGGFDFAALSGNETLKQGVIGAVEDAIVVNANEMLSGGTVSRNDISSTIIPGPARRLRTAPPNTTADIFMESVVTLPSTVTASSVTAWLQNVTDSGFGDILESNLLAVESIEDALRFPPRFFVGHISVETEEPTPAPTPAPTGGNSMSGSISASASALVAMVVAALLSSEP